MAHYPSAADYLQSRGVEPSADFYARLEHMRQDAWTLSRISDVAQIEQVKQSLVKALDEGLSFREWQQTLTPEMLALPQHYQETVFRTAMISSYNGAKWTHFRAHAERRPVLRYVAINDHRTRKSHHALHGLMMPVDDPRWQQLAAPNGFNCRCSMMSLSERQAKAFGYTGAPTEIPTWEDEHGVRHTAAPDNGWAHSPERSDLTEHLRQREAKAGLGKATYTEPDDIFADSKSIIAEGERLRTKYRQQLEDAIKNQRGHEAILEILRLEGVEVGAEANVVGTKDAVKQMKEALKVYPADWVRKSNEAGITIARNSQERAVARTLPQLSEGNVNWLKTAPKEETRDFSEFVVFAKTGEIKEGSMPSLIMRDTSEYITKEMQIATHVHEFGHRLQAVMPDLDKLFARFWAERTADDAVEKMADLFPLLGYDEDEITKKDRFPSPYWGKMYGDEKNPQPLEMLTMAFQSLVGGEQDKFNLLYQDKELFDFTLAIFARWRP